MVFSTPSAFSYDFWLNNSDELVELNCLMPNGVFIPLLVNKSSTFLEVKEDIWDEAAKYPLHGTLHDASSYVFVFVNTNSELEELYDENKRLCDVKPFGATLKLIEKQNDKAERVFAIQIGRLIGKALHEYDLLKNPEVNIFRSRMKILSQEIARERRNFTWFQKMRYQFPPRLTLAPFEQQIVSLHSPIPQKLRDGHFVIVIKFDNNDTTFTFNVSIYGTSDTLLTMILNKRATTLLKKNEVKSDFVLKVCGREEFIFGNYKLIEYGYIYECLTLNKTPTLAIISIFSVPLSPDENSYDFPEEPELLRLNNSFSAVSLRKKGKLVSSYNIDQKFTFKVCFITNLNTHAADGSTVDAQVGIQVGLFHGGKPLCQPKFTTEKLVLDGRSIYDEYLVFDIVVADIPRMARLCFALYEVCKNVKNVRAKRLKDANNEDYFVNPLGWVNTTVYDYKGQLKTGSASLYLWSLPDELQSDDVLHPLSSVVSNPDIKTATALSITYMYHEFKVIYPDIEQITEFANRYGSLDLKQIDEKHAQANKTLLDHVRNMNDQVTRYELHEQERKNLWSLRYHILKTESHLLSKLLDCVDWNNRFEVAETIALLRKWPIMSPEKALELLDFAYADSSIRNYAVRCLENASDDQILLYLLQLVQALKHECYLHSFLVEFLLSKSLNNQKIGHYLFWHLRSEMSVNSVSVRFGLILEAYCRGCPEHLRILNRQIGFMDKLKTTNELVRKRKDREKGRAFIFEYFQEPHCCEAFYSVNSPLDPAVKCKKIKYEKCRVMDSKARPLWLVFENDDIFGEDIHIIFKNGDDLRQDMLTLQMLRIMDNLWKEHGLDLRMNPYGCISTDNRVGLIEVVLNAETIANIQKEKGMFSATSAFKKGSILAWLKEHNTTEQSINKAIEEFTYSCAGYCVATFVLGVADRHSDNIMVKRSGQLFHIDFGHILGHFKEKFGFRRERVPFVLTHDFVHVINKGQTKGDIVEFQTFQRLCKNAFSILRQHGSLILSLFAMMISTGLPELSCEADLNYLHESLVLHMSEEEAEDYFQAKFSEALRNSWKTSLNWASHNVSKNNRI